MQNPTMFNILFKQLNVKNYFFKQLRQNRYTEILAIKKSAKTDRGKIHNILSKT